MADQTLKIAIDIDENGYVKGIRNMDEENKKFKKNSDSMFATLKKHWLGLTAAVATAVIGIKKALELVDEFNTVSEAAGAMEANFGTSASKVVNHLKRVSNGMISTKDIVLTANKAMALGVTKDLDTMGKLLLIAKERADIMGISTEQAFNQLAEGIGKNNPRMLEGLGIVTDGWDQQAKAAGKAKDTTFILNKVLEANAEILARSGTGAASFGDKMDKLNATIDDAKLLLGGLIANELSKFTENIEDMEKEGVRPLEIIEKGFKGVALAISLAATGLRVTFNAFQILLAPLTEGIKLISKIINDDFTLSLSNIKKLGTDAFDGLKKSVVTDAKDIKDALEDSAKSVVGIFKQSGSMLENLLDQQTDAHKNAEDKKTAATKKGVNERVAEYQKEQETGIKSFQAVAQGVNEMVGAFTELFNRKSEERIGKIEKEREAALNRLKSEVDETNIFTEQLAELEEESLEAKIERMEREKDAAVAYGDEKLAAEIDQELQRTMLAEEAKRREQDIANEKNRVEKERLSEEERINKQFDSKKRAERRKAFAKEKAAAIIQAVINTALAITAGLSTQPFLPLGIIMAGLATALGAVQIGIIASKPTPEFATGGFTGAPSGSSERRDTIPAMLSANETVLNASQGRNLFSALDAAGLLSQGARGKAMEQVTTYNNEANKSIAIHGPVYVQNMDGMFDEQVNRRLAVGGAFS